METNQAFDADNNQPNLPGNNKAPVNIPKDKADKKLTLEEEADLTIEEVEEMEQKPSEKGAKGSSGPEVKDIAV